MNHFCVDNTFISDCSSRQHREFSFYHFLKDRCMGFYLDTYNLGLDSCLRRNDGNLVNQFHTRREVFHHIFPIITLSKNSQFWDGSTIPFFFFDNLNFHGIIIQIIKSLQTLLGCMISLPNSGYQLSHEHFQAQILMLFYDHLNQNFEPGY